MVEIRGEGDAAREWLELDMAPLNVRMIILQALDGKDYASNTQNGLSTRFMFRKFVERSMRMVEMSRIETTLFGQLAGPRAGLSCPWRAARVRRQASDSRTGHSTSAAEFPAHSIQTSESCKR